VSERDPHDDEGLRRLRRGIARRLFGEDAPESAPEAEEPEAPRRPEPGDAGRPREDERSDPRARERREARALLAALLETGDKARTEMVRLVAREVRSYLEALELHKDLHHLLTNYSLEVKASIHLAPLERPRPAREEPGVGVALKPRTPDEGTG
jgi:hypothetical protein